MNKILVVVDMQNDFINKALGTKEAETILPNVVEKIKNHNGRIFVTQDTHKDNYLNTREGKYLPVTHCIKNTEGWELNKDVVNALTDKDFTLVYKPTFGSTLLPTLMEDFIEPETSIEIVGLCTDICVVSNALLLKAHFPENDIVVDATCCAGVTPESHNAALNTMKMCQIIVTD